MASPTERLRPVLSEIHDYWFGPLSSPTALPQDRKDMWFTQSDATDAEIDRRFGSAVEAAALLDPDLPALTPKEQVALVVLLDQFPRNLFRGSAKAFAQDGKALSIARHLVANGLTRFTLIERMFLAIPYEHSEDITDQDMAVWLMAGIAVEAADSFPDYARWALDSFIVHRDIIRRFGRFPYRNKALGRESTAAELAFLASKGVTNPSNPTEGTSLSAR